MFFHVSRKDAKIFFCYEAKAPDFGKIGEEVAVGETDYNLPCNNVGNV